MSVSAGNAKRGVAISGLLRRRRVPRRRVASRCGRARAGWRPISGSGARRGRRTGPAGVDQLVDACFGELDEEVAGRAVTAGEEGAVDAEARQAHHRGLLDAGRASRGSASAQNLASPGVGAAVIGGRARPGSGRVRRAAGRGRGRGLRRWWRGGGGSWPSRRRGRRPWVRRGRGGRVGAGCRRLGSRVISTVVDPGGISTSGRSQP